MILGNQAVRWWLVAAVLAGAFLLPGPRPAGAEERIQLQVDPSEARAVLAILRERSEGKTVSEADWQRLFESEPYVRLKKREESLPRCLSA